MKKAYINNSPKMNWLNWLLLVCISLSFSSCEKDELEGELESFKGRYTWEYTLYRKDWWSSTQTLYNASNARYIAEIEFNSKGKLIFYIDGKEIHKTNYSVEFHEVIENTLSLRVDPSKEDSKQLDLNDSVQFTLTNDTLTVDDFPMQSYDDANNGTNYFIRN